MPNQSKAQTIGSKGERWFQQSLPTSWIFQPPLHDVGVDGVVVICERGTLNGLEFRVQIKTSEVWQIRDGAVIQSGFRRANLRYLLTGFTPTLLVLYEVSNNRGVCSWINHLVYEDFDLLAGGSATVSLRVPLNRPVRPETWQHIGRELHDLTTAIGRHVSAAGRALPVLHFLNRMTKVLEHLDFAANARKSTGTMADEDLAVLLQLEVSCHRDVVLAVKSLEEGLRASGIKVEGIAAFGEEYIRHCSAFIIGFEETVNAPEAIKDLRVDIQQLRNRRLGFVRSIVSAMRQVTELGLGIKDHGDGDGPTKCYDDTRPHCEQV